MNAEFSDLLGAGRWPQAETLWKRYGYQLDALDDSGGELYERWADTLADTDPARAIGVYLQSLTQRRLFASWASSGSEGIARSMAADHVQGKYEALQHRVSGAAET